MSIDATPPRPLSILDEWLRPLPAVIRSAPIAPPLFPFTVTYAGCERAAARPDDDDPPRMVRTLVVSTSSGTTVASTSYYDCHRDAVIAGRPYTVDVQLWDAESGGIIERLDHDYARHYARRRR